MEKKIRNYKTERTIGQDGEPIIVIHGRDYTYFGRPQFEIVAVKVDKTNNIAFFKDCGSDEWKTYANGGVLKSMTDNAELCKRLTEILENFHLIRDGKPAIAC